MDAICHVVVAVPARNEQELVGACLRAVLDAGGNLRRSHPRVSLDVVVALDSCTDDTAIVVGGFPVRTVVTAGAGVGPARDAAVAAGLVRATGRGAGRGAREVWVANTDADSRVPPTWLTTQVLLADSGIDAVVGTVEPVGDAPAAVLAQWSARHTLREGHDHVHGANLGVRADVYTWAGGFGPLIEHEDVELVRRLRAGRCRVVATDRTRVTTSARRHNRVPGGFGGYLGTLTDGEMAL